MDSSSLNKTCKVDGCNGNVKAKEYCGKHYMRLQRHGDASCVKIELHGMRYTPIYKTWNVFKTGNEIMLEVL